MTLSTLIIGFAVSAAILTYLLGTYVRKPQKWWLFYLQNFVGVWFIFSGLVKAVDPMGTAFKMEQYFAAFQQTFQPTWLGFIAPLFPVLAKYAVGFSLFMIVLEIILGIALIIGHAPKWVSRVFLAVLVFFTVLTGFTYLTGYVPSNKNFFDFSSWGSFDKNQMRVSDCGCFGDFLKLDPKISFFKDLGLLIPGFLFLFFSKSFHQIWSDTSRKGILILSTIIALLFSLYNTFQNEPIWDFRAFKDGADIAGTRKAELDAAQAVQIENVKVKNKKTAELINVPYANYLKEFKKYPKEEFEINMVYGESSMPKTKISDYLIMDADGKDITLDLLNHPDYSLMVSAYHVHGTTTTEPIIMRDSLFADSVYVIKKDTFKSKVLVRVDELKMEKDVFTPDQHSAEQFGKINAVVNEFAKKGVMVYAVTGGLGTVAMNDLALKTNTSYPIYQADDVLLKTIMRSNPGLILWKNGKIVKKWHIKHLPSVDEVNALMTR